MPKIRVSVAIILPDSCLKKCSTTSVTLAAETGGVVSGSVIVLTNKSPALLSFVCLLENGNILLVHLQHNVHDLLRSRRILVVEELRSDSRCHPAA